jgi:hypothetical protein
MQGFCKSPLTDSNRRPPPYHGGFVAYTRVHARSHATHILLQIAPFEGPEMRRETSRVSFLMCPFCVRGLLSVLTTETSVVENGPFVRFNSTAR